MSEYQIGYALYDYEAQLSDELSIFEGERLYVWSASDGEWFTAQPVDREADQGIVPQTYVQLQVDDWDAQDPAPSPTPDLSGPEVDDVESQPSAQISVPEGSSVPSTSSNTGKKSLFSSFLRKGPAESQQLASSKSRPETVAGHMLVLSTFSPGIHLICYFPTSSRSHPQG